MNGTISDPKASARDQTVRSPGAEPPTGGPDPTMSFGRCRAGRINRCSPPLRVAAAGGTVSGHPEGQRGPGRKGTDWNTLAYGHAAARPDPRDGQTVPTSESPPYVSVLSTQCGQQRARAQPNLDGGDP